MTTDIPIRAGTWVRYGKRIFDLAFATVLVIVLCPFLLLTAIVVRMRLGSPVIFSQRRLGVAATEFTMYKFRSMSDARDRNGNLLSDGERLTRLGKFLRSTSVDELPQIFNIIRGDMSFIGPRATLLSYKDALLENYPRRFDALPGITSLPAVKGRNALTWDEKFTLDVAYVERLSFRMDAEIFFKTILVVLNRKGINQQGEITVAPYNPQSNKKA